MSTIPPGDRAKVVKDLDLDQDQLPIERALGVHWDMERDFLGVQIKEKSHSKTKTGILSIISSTYDPLGFGCPYILQGKLLFQDECCIVGKGWDDPLESDTEVQWVKWPSDLPVLEGFQVDRCLIPTGFGQVKKSHLHHFADASKDAYGSVSYTQLVNAQGKVHCSFLIGKS